MYIKEIEDLTSSLKRAYISEGVPFRLAGEYSTQNAVKSLSTNASNEKIKLIMEAGTFNNMNEAVSKFVTTTTEVSASQSNVVFIIKDPIVKTFVVVDADDKTTDTKIMNGSIVSEIPTERKIIIAFIEETET